MISNYINQAHSQNRRRRRRNVPLPGDRTGILRGGGSAIMTSLSPNTWRHSLPPRLHSQNPSSTTTPGKPETGRTLCLIWITSHDITLNWCVAQKHKSLKHDVKHTSKRLSILWVGLPWKVHTTCIIKIFISASQRCAIDLPMHSISSVWQAITFDITL